MLADRVKLYLFFLFNSVALTNSVRRCSPEYCNLAGDCYIIHKRPYCSCYEEIFEGNYCEGVRDLCKTERNTCTIKQSCRTYVGQVICLTKFRSGNADHKLPTNPLCIYNVRAIYGQNEYIVLSFEHVEDVDMEITLSTPTYLIAHVPRARLLHTQQIQHTSNLTRILHGLGIRLHMKFPYNNAYYYVFEAKHYTLGTNRLIAKIKTFGTDGNDRSQTINIPLLLHVARMSFERCVPLILFDHGTNPAMPLLVNVALFTNLQAIVEKRCSQEKLYTQWSIYDSSERITFYYSEIGEDLLLKIPRYTLWYESLLHLYPNIILTVVLAYYEKDEQWSFTRCYLKVLAPNVFATIEGGAFREVSALSSLLVDGSHSREPARNISTDQQLIYTWTLSNMDGSNAQYLEYETTTSIIQIPSSMLQMNANQLITLKVANSLARTRTHTTTQTIHAISDKYPLHIAISCVKNCDYNQYNAHGTLHLLGVCDTCELPLQFIWKLNGKLMVHDKPRFIITLNGQYTHKLIVDLVVQNSVTRGRTTLELMESKPPTGGDCEITPDEGFECETEFYIQCKDFEQSIVYPLLYKFKSGRMYEEVHSYGETYLFISSSNETLAVHICALHSACTIIELFVDIEPTSFIIPEDLGQMVLEGRRYETFCVLQTVIATPATLNAISEYFRVIHLDVSKTLLELVNTLQIAFIFMKFETPLLFQKSAIAGDLLFRVKQTFHFVIHDTEILDMSEELFFELSMLITDIVHYQIQDDDQNLQPEQFLRVFNDPFSEEYFHWDPLDSSVAMRIKIYLRLTMYTFGIYRILGVVSYRFIEPEQPFDHTTGVVNYKLEKFDKRLAPIEYVSRGSFCAMDIPLKAVKALRKLVKSNDLMIQAWCSSMNIFWWAPEAWNPTAAILAVNIISPNGRVATEDLSHLDVKYNVKLHKINESADALKSDVQYAGVLRSNMIIYKVKLPGQVNLLVKFLNTTANLRVMLKLNEEPTVPGLGTESCLVPKNNSRKLIVLKNFCITDGVAYIGVVKENTYDTDSAQYVLKISGQECVVWGKHGDDYLWTKHGCYAKNVKQKPLYSKCKLNHLSIFSAREYPIKPFPLEKRRKFARNYTLNVPCVLFNVILILGLMVLLIFRMLYSRLGRVNLIRVIKSRDDIDPESENIIVHLRTGGQLSAVTTANIKLVFRSNLGRYKVVIYQNPGDPYLDVNTSCMLRLSNKKIQLPCRLTVSHDSSGRYPSWYIRNIQIDDLKNNLSETFYIRAWLKRGQKIHLSSYPNDSQYNVDIDKTLRIGRFGLLISRFRYYFRFYYSNWFMLQPILGPWRYCDESCNIYERTCIWICKTVLVITIVFTYFKHTSHINYYDYDDRDKELTLSGFLGLSLCCYICTLLYDILLQHLSQRAFHQNSQENQ